MRRSIVASCALVLVVAACTEQPAALTGQQIPAAAPPSNAAAAVSVNDQIAEVTFVDTDAFDDELSDALRADPRQVDVVAPERFGLNKIPDRLEKWIAAVKSSGGKVKAQPLPPANQVAERGVVDIAIDLVVAIVKAVREDRLYAPSHDYDVYLFYRKDTGIVETTRFIYRGT